MIIDVLESEATEEFNNVATFSSIEHASLSRLGRFSDPLNPTGDLNVMKQVHCMMKPSQVYK